MTFHDKFLKKKVHFPAYSEIFTPIQWVVVPLFGYLAVWMTIPGMHTSSIAFPLLGSLYLNSTQFVSIVLLFFFTYFAVNAHDLPEGIHDVAGDKALSVKTYATSFGVPAAAKISFGMFIIAAILATLLVYSGTLSLIFYLPFLALFGYTLRYSYRLVKADDASREQLSSLVGRKGYDFFLFSYNLMFLDIVLRLVLSHFNVVL